MQERQGSLICTVTLKCIFVCVVITVHSHHPLPPSSFSSAPSPPPPPAPSGEHHRQPHSHQGIPRGSSQPQGHLACGDRGCARARGVGQDQPGEVPQGRAVHDRRAPVPAYWDRRGLQAASGQRQLAPGRGRPGLRGRAGEDSHRRCPQAHARPAEQRWRQ